MDAATVKLGLFLPADLHRRMVVLAQGAGPGALQDAYARAFSGLLDALDSGLAPVFAAVRGPKQRVTVRLARALAERIRARLTALNLKLTDFACAALARFLAAAPGA